MKRILPSSTFIFLITALLCGPAELIATNEPDAFLKQQNSQTGFIENKGQIIDQNNQLNPSVLFLLNNPGFNVQLRSAGWSYDVYKVETSDTALFVVRHSPFAIEKAKSEKPRANSYQFSRIDFDLLNSNPNPEIETSGPSKDFLNYYTTGTPAEGVKLVRSYKSITYKNIYPGIDLVFNCEDLTKFKYNFIVHPEGDLNSIQIRIKGPEIKLQATGSLLLATSLGTIEEEIPRSFYRNGSDIPVKCIFRKTGPDAYGITADHSEPGTTLVIDPIPRRVWATYYGGSNMDEGYVILSNDGNIILSGQTMSLTNIATSGAFQTTFGGSSDMYFAKMTFGGQRLWGTYFGGPWGDWGYAYSADKKGNIYICGTTLSLINIASPGAYQQNKGGSDDAFLGKFNSSGFRLWSTYYGGTFADDGMACTADSNGNVYLCGITLSPSGIASNGSHQPDLAGYSDGFLVKFDSSGQRLWGTYYGGTLADGADFCHADDKDHVILSGFASSSNNISTPGSFQPNLGNTLSHNCSDGFLVLFNGDGQRQWGTYYGGTGCNDQATMCKIGTDQFIYLDGTTNSPNAIASPGSFQPVFGGSVDAFIAKFTLAGSRIWGTYYGGLEQEYGQGFDVDDSLNIFLAGNTFSSGNIATPNAFQTNFGGGEDMFLAKFDSSGQRKWATYYGDTTGDAAWDCVVTGDTIYLAGASNGGRLTTPGSFQHDYSGSGDGLLVKFVDCYTPDTVDHITGEDTLCIPQTMEAYSIPSLPFATSYLWEFPPGATITSGQGTTSVDVDFGLNAVSGYVTVKGVNSCGTGEPNQLFLHLNQRPVPIITGDSLLCLGETRTYHTQQGKSQYQWSVSAGGLVTAGGTSTEDSITVHWIASGAQWVSAGFADTNNCVPLTPTIHNVQVTAPANVNITISLSEDTVCTGTQVTFSAHTTNGGSAPSFQWKVNGTGVGPNDSVYTYIPLNNDLVSCILTSSLTGCVSNNPASSIPYPVSVSPNLLVGITLTSSPATICAGSPVNFTANPTNGGLSPSYQWKVNGINVGTNSFSYSFIPLNGDLVSCVLTSSEPCTIQNPVPSAQYPVSVIAIQPVSVTISTATNPFCLGSSVTFTAAPTNGGVPVYQWKVNGINVGISSSTYTYNPVGGDVVSCIMNSSLPCTSGNPATSNSITMIVNTGLPAGVTISATPNPFCPGGSVTCNATPTNGGPLPTYQWKVNGTNAGTNSSSYTFNPNNSDSVRVIMTSNLPCVTGSPVSSSKIILNGTLAPTVTFTACFDTITTINAKPIKLKGGIPLGGTYSGPGVNSITGYFNPALAGVGTKTITYSYTNSMLCSAAKSISILDLPSSILPCGSNLTDPRDNHIYPTIQIGSQCWMSSNLNFGNILSSSQDQRDNCIAEKYCYNDSPVNCTNQGGLYQWDELMLFDETPADQEFCPPGWHIPTENEWNTLFANYINSGFAASPLKYSGYSGFNALLSGARHINKGWNFQGFATFFWSSTSFGTDKAWVHGMNDVDPSVSVYPASRVNAFSVRCLKD